MKVRDSGIRDTKQIIRAVTKSTKGIGEKVQDRESSR